MESGSTTHILRFHSKPVLALSWSPLSEHLLASAGQDNTIALWDVRRASGPLKQLDQHNGGSTANSASGGCGSSLGLLHAAVDPRCSVYITK
jgi:DNA excision repair protein ERCC-8